jgi:hypothetical protein
MKKTTEIEMEESCFFHLDLISKKRWNFIASLIQEIKAIDFDPQILEVICSCMGINRDNRIEIYVEEFNYDGNIPHEFMDLIEKIEIMIGGFEQGSCIKWHTEVPYSYKSWIKNPYDWDFIEEENDTDYYDGNSWEDPDWDNWE